MDALYTTRRGFMLAERAGGGLCAAQCGLCAAQCGLCAAQRGFMGARGFRRNGFYTQKMRTLRRRTKHGGRGVPAQRVLYAENADIAAKNKAWRQGGSGATGSIRRKMRTLRRRTKHGGMGVPAQRVLRRNGFCGATESCGGTGFGAYGGSAAATGRAIKQGGNLAATGC